MTYPHGNYLRYRNGGCKCRACTDANTIKEKEYKLRKLRGVATGNVAEVQAHVAALEEAGATRNAIAQAAGVSPSWVYRMAKEDPKYISYETAKKILDVSFEDLPDNAKIHAGPTWKLFEEVCEHITKKEVGRRLGWEAYAPLGKKRVLVSTAKNMRQIHAEVTRPRCEQCGEPPLAEGRWCLRCFKARANPSASTSGGCGTRSGYRRHARKGEPACGACREARARDEQLRRAS